MDLHTLRENIKLWAKELGFQELRVSDLDLDSASLHLKQWLQKKHHGTMHYMEKNQHLRQHPEQLHPGTLRVLCARMDYLPENAAFVNALKAPEKAYISRYALGKDYHKIMRKRLTQLAKKISLHVEHHQYRAFVDSAPVLERAMAEKSGLGWIGKNTLLLNAKAGSWYFLGEVFTNLPLPVDQPVPEQCGACKACLEICPTRAFVAPYQLDARRCISYLTIEYKGIIDVELGKKMGNRIYGCDDCQLICPWNRFSSTTNEAGFKSLNHLHDIELLALFDWCESEFLKRFEGSPIRRIGYAQWVRNLAIAIGNGIKSRTALSRLRAKLNDPDINDVTRVHLLRAIEQQSLAASTPDKTDQPLEKLTRSIKKLHPRDA